MRKASKPVKQSAKEAPTENEAAFNTHAAATQQAIGGIAHETGELHRLLVESVDDYAIFALDPEGYILSWNAGAQRFKGYTANEIIGKHFSIFYPQAKIDEGFPAYELREAARTGRFEDEGWRVRKDGTQFWANVVITALRDPSGALVGYAKVTRDLTERRMAEEALRESEERFRLLVQNVKDYAIFMLDPKGYITTWNEGAQRIKGYTADEIIGKHFSIFYTDEDLATRKPDRELKIAIATGKYEEEGWRLRKDGSRFWANVLITALRRPDGSLAGFAKVTRDLTERRAAEQRALEDARKVAAEEGAREVAEVTRIRAERLQSVTAAFSGAHTVAEMVRVIIDKGLPAVGATAGALGLVDEPTATINVVDDKGMNRLPEWTRSVGLKDDLPMSVAARTGKPLILRSQEEREKQFPKIAPVLASFGPTTVWPLESRGRRVGALSIHMKPDVKLTDDLIQYIDSFARQAAQALERATLYEAEQAAREKADEANRAKSQFLAAMSHELRTPLNAIGGYADLIALGVRGPVTPEQIEDLDRIKRSQQHLLGIINDILNFSKIEAGQANYEFASVPMREVFDSVGHMIQPQANAKGLKFTVHECPPDLAVWADRPKVEQILLNLLSNAVKFTQEGVVSLSCEVSEPREVQISVKDTGVGIPEDQLQRIFEPFVQVGRSLTATQEGTGLGLAISRDLARAMNGEIDVTSSIGNGAEFMLYLPRATASQD